MTKNSYVVKLCVIQNDICLSPFRYFFAPAAECAKVKVRKAAQNLKVTLTVSTWTVVL